MTTSTTDGLWKKKTVQTTADVLPEVLRHTLPPKIFQYLLENSNSSSLSTASKWVLQSNPKSGRVSLVSADALNHLRAYVSLPQVTFGPKSGVLIFGVTASKLEVHNIDDLRTKGKDLFQPRFETIREQLATFRTWTEDIKEMAFGKGRILQREISDVRAV